MSFVRLFADDCPIFHDNCLAFSRSEIYKYWESLGYVVRKWDGDQQQKSLFFYRSRFISKLAASGNEYVIVPGLENPRWVILNKKEIISKHGLIIKPTSRKARFAWGVAKIFNWFGLFTIIFPDRLVARNSEIGSAVFHKNECYPSILYTGAPGKYQKFTIQYNNQLFEPVCYLKIANTIGGKDRLINESKALKIIGEADMNFLESPDLLGFVNAKGFNGIVQNNILGNEDLTTLISEMDVQALTELCNKLGLRDVYLIEYLSVIGFNGIVDEFPVLFDYFEIIKEKKIFLSSSHGDYIPWNRFVSRGLVKVIDWETFKYRPLFYDACYFIIHKAILIDKDSIMAAIEECVSCSNEILSNINYLSFPHESIDTNFYVLLSLVELYLHYKSNKYEADNDFLTCIRNGIVELQQTVSI